jgi:hypothetical protein
MTLEQVSGSCVTTNMQPTPSQCHMLQCRELPSVQPTLTTNSLRIIKPTQVIQRIRQFFHNVKPEVA